MPGLIDQEVPQQPAPQPTAPQQQPQGLVDQQAGDTKRGSRDPNLTKIMDQVLNGIPPGRRSAVERLVLAGLAVMFAPAMQSKLQEQVKSGPPEQSIPQGIAALMSLLQSKARGPLPPAALVPAAVVLSCEALDYLESAGLIQVTPELIGKVNENLLAFMMQKLGMTGNTLVNAKLEANKQQLGRQQQPATQPQQGAM